MPARPDPERDALADALALLDATHRADSEAIWVLLDNGDLARIAAYLAKIAEDLLCDLSGWVRSDVPVVLARQRDGWLPPEGPDDSEDMGPWQD
jgi:hypothetical protein